MNPRDCHVTPRDGSVTTTPLSRGGCHAVAVTVPPVTPRLLNLRQSAAYLNISYWSVRDYALAGYLPVVQLPALRPREGAKGKTQLRRVLIDRVDLDKFINSRKGDMVG